MLKRYLNNCNKNKNYILNKLISFLTYFRTASLWKKLIILRKMFILINAIIIVTAVFKTANIDVDTILIVLGYSCLGFTDFINKIFLWYFELLNKLLSNDPIYTDDWDTNNIINKIKKSEFPTVLTLAICTIPPVIILIYTFSLLWYLPADMDDFQNQRIPLENIPLEEITRQEV